MKAVKERHTTHSGLETWNLSHGVFVCKTFAQFGGTEYKVLLPLCKIVDKINSILPNKAQKFGYSSFVQLFFAQ